MALQQGAVTITGYLGADPQQYGRNPSRPACTFRLGSTRRYQDRNGVWQQLPTTWLTVKAFRGLAANIMQSLHRGDTAIVTGLLNHEQWRDEQGVDHSRLVLEASNVGLDLNYVVTMSMRTPRAGYTGQQAPSQMASDEQGSPMRPQTQQATSAAPQSTLSRSSMAPGDDGGNPVDPFNQMPPDCLSPDAAASMPQQGDQRDAALEPLVGNGMPPQDLEHGCATDTTNSRKEVRPEDQDEF